MIICRTPFRISYFGGGTDFPDWYSSEKGMVISTSINKYCFLSLRTLPPLFKYKHKLRYYKNEFINDINKIKHPSIKQALKIYNKENIGLELIHNADLPAQTGLGASSSFSVSLINAFYKFNGKNITKELLAQEASHFEQKILKEYVGTQDQYACTYGGFNSIEFSSSKIKVKTLNADKKVINKLNNFSLLFYTGIVRDAKTIEKDKIKNIKKNTSSLKEIYQIAKEAKKILLSKDKEFIYKLGMLMRDNWELKKNLSKKVSNDKINTIYDYALKNGAISGKLLGAGSGGFFLFLVNNKKDKIKLISKLSKLQHINYIFENIGSKIIYNKDSDAY